MISSISYHRLLIVTVAVTAALGAIVDVNETETIPCDERTLHAIPVIRPPDKNHTGASLRTTQRQHLELSDSLGHDRTVAFVDGAASDTVSYKLRLPLDEFITSMSHVPNDTSIITESTASYVTHKYASYRVENITLRHEFEGNIGPAKYTLTALTNKGRTFLSTGRYYVTGIVGVSKDANGTTTTVTGVAGTGITFNSPDDVTLKAKDGVIEVPLQYQPPGPDVSKASVVFADIMGQTRVQIAGRTLSSKSNLVEGGPEACTTVTQATKRSNGSYAFVDLTCAVGFDKLLNKLLVRIKPRKVGFVIVQLTTPALDAAGESSEATLRVEVKKPANVPPVVIMSKAMSLKLDHYGREIFTIAMNKTRTPYQANNATDYLIDLPGDRYARVDFNLSKMEKDVQQITFMTVPAGQEDPEALRNMKNVLKNMKVEAASLSEASPEATSDGIVIGHSSRKYVGHERHRPLWHLSMNLGFGLRSFDSNRAAVDAAPSVSPEATNVPQVPVQQESHVFVIIPPAKSYQTAVNINNRPLLTEFAANTLATISKAEKDASKTYVSVSLVLYNYSTDNFSEHKSQQLGRTLADIVFDKSDTNTSAELVRKRKRRSDIIVTYRIITEKLSSQIARNLTKVDEGVADLITEKAMMRSGSVAVYDAMVLPGFGDPNFNGAAGEGGGLSGSTVGLVVAAIVALCLIVMIPLFVFCFGFIVTRRNERTNQAGEAMAGGGATAGGQGGADAALGSGYGSMRE